MGNEKDKITSLGNSSGFMSSEDGQEIQAWQDYWPAQQLSLVDFVKIYLY